MVVHEGALGVEIGTGWEEGEDLRESVVDAGRGVGEVDGCGDLEDEGDDVLGEAGCEWVELSSLNNHPFSAFLGRWR